MSLASQITLLAQAIGAKIKAITPQLLPSGGTAGQVLTKSSGTDYAASWAAVAATDVYGQPYGSLWQTVDVVGVVGAALTVIGPTIATSGTPTSGALSAGSYRTGMYRQTHATGTTTATMVGLRQSVMTRWRGNVAGAGGFDFVGRFALSLLTGHQAMIGLTSIGMTGEPSTLGQSVCLGADSTDTNLQWLTRDGTNFTKVDTGVAKTITDVLRVRLIAAPNGSTVAATLYDETTGTMLSTATLSATLPLNTGFLSPNIQVRNGATTTSAGFDFLRWVSTAYNP